MNDLTIIYNTANKLPEPFFSNVRRRLLESACGIPIVSISKRPIDFGDNFVVDEPSSVPQLYRDILLGAKTALTRYVALCEDDQLYSSSHFTCYRPADDVFGYNLNRWAVFAWQPEPVFSTRERGTISQLIAPRDLLVEALEEREWYVAHHELTKRQMDQIYCEPGRHERWYKGLTPRKRETFRSLEPNVDIQHLRGLTGENQGRWKALGPVKARSLGQWKSASECLLEVMGREEWDRQINWESKGANDRSRYFQYLADNPVIV